MNTCAVINLLCPINRFSKNFVAYQCFIIVSYSDLMKMMSHHLILFVDLKVFLFSRYINSKEKLNEIHLNQELKACIRFT